MINVDVFNGVMVARFEIGSDANGEYAVSYDGGMTYEWTGLFLIQDVIELVQLEQVF